MDGAGLKRDNGAFAAGSAFPSRCQFPLEVSLSLLPMKFLFDIFPVILFFVAF